MRSLAFALVVIPLIVGCRTEKTSDPRDAGTPVRDKPVQATGRDIDKLNEVIKPYIERARASYPDAKRRYLAGLPPGHTFFITTRIQDENGYEQLFVQVKSIENDMLHGIVSSDIQTVKSVKRGGTIDVPEAKVMDWLITRPDGSEEGNVVGNFLDTYQGTKK